MRGFLDLKIMKLSNQQMSQAVASARKLIKEHSTPFMNYNKMVTDDQISEALTQILDSVTWVK
jgi:hypothetical protein